jgi:hypothetical protein
MSMLFMPEIETYLRFTAEQWNRYAATDPTGSIKCESRVATASLDYYMPGQPNRRMEDEVMESLLWVSGLGNREVVLTAMRDSCGNIASVTGVLPQYQDYYKYDLLWYPAEPVKVGDSWERKIVMPMALDWNQPPYDLEITGRYTLKRITGDGRNAEIAFNFSCISDHAMQKGQKVMVNVKLIREGSIITALEDGFPLTVKSNTRFDFVFSDNNYIRSEEDFTSEYVPIVAEIE